MRPFELLLLSALTTSACTTVHSAYLTNLSAPVTQARPIEAEASKTVFLAMNFNNDYAYEAREKLYAQCPGGNVTGVLSTYETTWIVLFVNHRVTARGYCVPAAPAAAVATAATPEVGDEAPTPVVAPAPPIDPPVEVDVSPTDATPAPAEAGGGS